MTEIKKEITHYSSTVIDEEQSLQICCNKSIANRKIKCKNGTEVDALVTISEKSLLEANLPPLEFTINGILPKGLFVLADSPQSENLGSPLISV